MFLEAFIAVKLKSFSVHLVKKLCQDIYGKIQEHSVASNNVNMKTIIMMLLLITEKLNVT